MHTLTKLFMKLKAYVKFTQAFVLASLLLWNIASIAATPTPLADSPLFSGSNVPGNVALSLSVEFPTALGSAYTSSYNINNEYVGYWDANKCYSYSNNVVKSAPVALSGLLYNTGVKDDGSLNSGQSDRHWNIISTPRFQSTTNLTKARALDSVSSTSLYLSTAGDVRTGDYSYESDTFTIPSGTDPNTVAVSFSLWTDDSLVDLQINGVSTGITAASGWNTPATVTIPAGSFNAATNTITIIINNAGSSTNPTGIRIDDMSVTKQDVAVGPDGNYFVPQASASNHACNTVSNGRWSGNFLNWALTQTIDPFRFALTGGYRAVDKVGLTVLEKAWASGQGGTVANPTITNDATTISKSTPFTSLSTLKIRISGLGKQFYFTSTGDNYNPGTVLADSKVTATPNASSVYQMSARVQVCKPGILESNCTLYSNGDYKPTGLIQKNSLNLNFAAFGYLNDSDSLRDGGVLRAKMAPLGPLYKSGVSALLTNPRPEWSESTGIFYDNPDSSDASASGVSNSGVINYLNKFGLYTPGYKTYDPVSELYYATGRYFRNKGNVNEYTLNATTAMKDGFPVITTWNDPIQYSCQSNFIIGIGDTNSWHDGNLPGSTLTSGEPAKPAQVSADKGSLTDTTTNYVDVHTSTNRIGAMEGLGNLGDVNTAWCCTGNTFQMAGLAYDMHTRDIRPDLADSQTITTYWLDVLESGDRKDYGSVGMRNQYWLTAKYGGFTVPTSFAPYSGTATPLSTSSWDADNDGDPDNYYRANNPQKMIDGLTKAFDNIVSKVNGASNLLALTSPSVQTGDMSFATGYKTGDWTGDIIGSTVSFDTNNQPITTAIWHAQDKIEAQAWDSGRFIATSNCVATTFGQKTCTGVPFRLNSLSAENQAALASPVTTAQNILNYLRGDRSNQSLGLRVRKSILGDIVNSKVVAVGVPGASYSDAYNPGYSAFKTSYANRITMAYAGANDGMLHGVRGTNNGAGGTELFAYIPSMTFKGPNNTPATDGLVALTNSSFIHHAYVDATPVVTDVNFGGGASDWHSLLVGGLGKGGKGYYALDVTNPVGLSNEAALASAVKWEFTHNDMGYSYGKPVIVKINSTNPSYSGWAVIVTSGYNTADGNGYFFVLNAQTGALIKEIKTYATAPTSDAGLATARAFIPNLNSYQADAVYAADLLGSLWRLNLTDLTVENIAKLQDATGSPQAVTVRPAVEIDKATGKRYVFVATGKLLDDSDLPNDKNNTFYAINDGSSDAGSFFKTSTLPSGVSFPITRSKMDDNTTTFATTGVISPKANSVGWYIDLADKYRVNVDLATNAGIIGFVANKPSSTVCSTSGSSNGSHREYYLRYGSGKSALKSSTTGFVQGGYLSTSIDVYKAPNATSPSFAISQEGAGGLLGSPELDNGLSVGFQLLNWRDLPTAD
jgi:type IV pilus assembly protein PilY1